MAWAKDGMMYHIKTKVGDVGRYVLLPGDPFRTDLMASYLDDAKIVAHSREHKTWTGTLLGEKVSVTSTGMGCPSTAIAVEELIACGADTFIRVGTVGPMMPKEKRNPASIGGIITGSVRDEGTTKQYVPLEYPAIADRHLVAALADSAKKLGYVFDEGISLTKDSLYTLLEPETVPMGKIYDARYKMWQNANVMVTEMESAAVLIVSALRGCRASAIASYSDIADPAGAMDKAIKTACEAFKLLIESDSKK
ncbi:MAG: nucleoside phosphorylase [Clostridia bacterium]|nr:nucleoside phosphorylase [Clostridia bacterium]